MASLPPERSRSPGRRRAWSPPRWAGRRGRTERGRNEVVVERIVERVAPAGNYPVLTKANYHDWAALMRVMLQARGLWTAVSDDTDDFAEDRMALEVITKAVPLELMGMIANKESA